MGELLTEIILWLRWTMLLPLAVGIFRWPKLMSAQKLLVLLMVYSFATEGLAELFAWLYENNMGVYHFYTLIEFVLLVLIFHLGYKNFLSKSLVYTMLALFSLITIAEMWFSGLVAFNSFSTTLEGILLIVLSLGFFIASLHRLDIPRLSQHPIFWVACGTLLYFTANILLFAYQNLLIRIYNESEDGAIDYFGIWVIHGILNFILYIFYTRSLMSQWREPK